MAPHPSLDASGMRGGTRGERRRRRGAVGAGVNSSRNQFTSHVPCRRSEPTEAPADALLVPLLTTPDHRRGAPGARPLSLRPCRSRRRRSTAHVAGEGERTADVAGPWPPGPVAPGPGGALP